MTDWIYDGNIVTDVQPYIEEGYKAFVYVILRDDGKSYIGKKLLQFTTHRRRASKSRRKVIRESDWRDYWGSSSELQDDVARLGKDRFSRKIIRFCRTKSEASYYELREQAINDVLLKPDQYYNAYIGGRISRKQLGIK
jgi:hypothetical protein